MPAWPPEADADAGAEPDRRPAAEEDDFAAPISRQRLVDELAGDDRPDAARARRRAPEAAARPSETVAADGNGADDEWDEEAPPEDDIDDVAVTIGRVVGIHGPVLWGTLYDDEDNTGASAARMGALVSLRGPESRVFGIVNGLRRERDGGGAQGERTVFEIQTLGEVPTAGPDAATAVFRRGVSRYPPLGAPVTTVTVKDLANVYARPRSSNVHIGQLRHNRKVPAFVVTDSLLGKHFAVLGTTGSGKSCAVTVILRSILAEHPTGPRGPARSAQRVRQRVHGHGRAAEPEQSAAAVLAAELRGDRAHPGRGRRRGAALHQARDPQGRDPPGQAQDVARRGLRHRRHALAVPLVRSDQRAPRRAWAASTRPMAPVPTST